MATRIDGKALAAKVKAQTAEAAKSLYRRPGLAVILVGNDPASRVYVTGKDVERNWVYIGDNEDLFSRALEAVDLNLIACDAIPSPLRCTAKIRHSRSEAAAVAEQTGEDTLRVTFDRPQRAIAPGQSVVLYDGDVVIGGGTITRAL